MENWWGFQWRRFAGLVNVSGTAKYKMTKGTQDGSTAEEGALVKAVEIRGVKLIVSQT